MRSKLLSVIFILIIGQLFISCKSTENLAAENNNKETFDWLLGKWKRINDKEGQSTYEFWKKAGMNKYVGHGYTLHKQDTVWQENMQLKKENKSWSLNIYASNNSGIVKFKITEVSDQSFTCFNAQNEFPKTISYNRKGNQINAIISDEENSIPFNFIKEN